MAAQTEVDLWPLPGLNARSCDLRHSTDRLLISLLPAYAAVADGEAKPKKRTQSTKPKLDDQLYVGA